MEVKLLRPIAVKGEHCGAGEIIDLPDNFAREMIAVKKACIPETPKKSSKKAK